MEFYKKNKQDWINIQMKIFPNGIPSHCEWTNLNDIVSILNVIGSIRNSNHMFYPTGGGLDIELSKLSTEQSCIEIFTGLTDILKPKRLLFESIDANKDWNYFRIETSELEPTGVYGDKDYPSEELIEIEQGSYISRSFWDEGEYKGKKLPTHARVLTRHLRGSFVIFSKSSPYNLHSSTYDGRHNKMTSDEFLLYIKNVVKNGW